jgi:hypothetical protein
MVFAFPDTVALALSTSAGAAGGAGVGLVAGDGEGLASALGEEVVVAAPCWYPDEDAHPASSSEAAMAVAGRVIGRFMWSPGAR